MGLTPRIRLRHIQGEYVVSTSREPLRRGEQPLVFSDANAALRFLGGLLLDGDSSRELGRLYHRLDVGAALPPTGDQAAHAIASQMAAGYVRVAPASLGMFGPSAAPPVVYGPPAPASDTQQAVDVIGLIYAFEAQKGVSNRLHWPGGSSGVTLGPGYDLRYRSKEEVIKDLAAVGVDEATARKVAEGCGKADQAAKTFADANKSLVDLSVDQEKQLLGKVLPKYEKAVDDAVKVRLNANERAALVSLVYNIGAANFKNSTLVAKLNRGDDRDAVAQEFARWNKSGGKVLAGLTKRRAAEAKLFLTAPTAPAQPASPPRVRP